MTRRKISGKTYNETFGCVLPSGKLHPKHKKTRDGANGGRVLIEVNDPRYGKKERKRK